MSTHSPVIYHPLPFILHTGNLALAQRCHPCSAEISLACFQTSVKSQLKCHLISKASLGLFIQSSIPAKILSNPHFIFKHRSHHPYFIFVYFASLSLDHKLHVGKSCFIHYSISSMYDTWDIVAEQNIFVE